MLTLLIMLLFVVLYFSYVQAIASFNDRYNGNRYSNVNAFWLKQRSIKQMRNKRLIFGAKKRLKHIEEIVQIGVNRGAYRRTVLSYTVEYNRLLNTQKDEHFAVVETHNKNSNIDNVFTTSIYGTNPKYFDGLKNVIDDIKNYPEWKLRIYAHVNATKHHFISASLQHNNHIH